MIAFSACYDSNKAGTSSSIGSGRISSTSPSSSNIISSGSGLGVSAVKLVITCLGTFPGPSSCPKRDCISPLRNVSSEILVLRRATSASASGGQCSRPGWAWTSAIETRPRPAEDEADDDPRIRLELAAETLRGPAPAPGAPPRDRPRSASPLARLRLRLEPPNLLALLPAGLAVPLAPAETRNSLRPVSTPTIRCRDVLLPLLPDPDPLPLPWPLTSELNPGAVGPPTTESSSNSSTSSKSSIPASPLLFPFAPPTPRYSSNRFSGLPRRSSLPPSPRATVSGLRIPSLDPDAEGEADEAEARRSWRGTATEAAGVEFAEEEEEEAAAAAAARFAATRAGWGKGIPRVGR